MSKKYLPLLIIGFILWILFGLFFCKTCWLGKATAASSAATTAAKTVAPAAAAKAAMSGWLLKDGARFSTSCETGFDFNRSSRAYNANTSNSFKNCMTETSSYLKKNPNRALNIIGKYSETETESGIFKNLGLARADNVKKYLIGLGVAASQLTTTSKIIPDGLIKNNILREGVDFEFGAATNDTANRLADIKSRLIDASPAVTIRFNSGSDAINLTAQQQQDFSDIVYYLDNEPDSKVEIGGHTDNIGGVTTNVNLSQGRADRIKQFLVTNGIDATKMAAQGYGPNNPLNTNSTAQERALNRRVEVALKHN